ncbi:uncharacterized protein GGS22DRAFT_160309 [Annulohypoxylon maeteangense]|uniref:uncharacterized protein n=1 Tax=Annulohypoxylon maeteangense TaxID=1927788 RepID=UPI00200807F4|nr:uncharacterized protein GGS22DRAFT_160309 [Annulohypoxylon maeteangense]KAI0886228.1 hypothetical protein GGS22DRAFT_160309 [Annulohypoxylon maeteangense]
MGMSWTGFLLTYLFGGVTFIPLAIAVVLLHAHYTFPVRDDSPLRDDANDADNIVQPGDDISALRDTQKEESKQRLVVENDVAAGYFAVCREYTPMGINAKPIERSTPVGSTTVAAPSQSVYQSMYRSIFDRKQTPGPLDDHKSVSQRPKKAGNVFYVVLRHGHLMLFDDDEQLEVRHVISLAHHDVSIYSGGDPTPEGELFIKRNALCLRRKTEGKDNTPDAHMSKPFYLFSENCSAKEDFYFSLLRNQEQSFTGNLAPKPQKFEVKNIISLVQKLHSSEDHIQTRWLNAFIGRMFLGIYKTKDIENFIREKITKKISRVNRPSFLSSIKIQNIDTGDSAPYFMNPKLKDFSVEGECGMEADVKYTGNFRLEVAATVRIDLGARFKAREVSIILAVVLRKLEGHIFFKIKPPPSNRMWFSFQSMPKIEMNIEPIVSSRQITYTVILRQIENRIKEVIAETLVAPFWDDIPFFNTEHKQWRGGIFEGDDAVERSPDHEAIAAQLGNVDEVSQIEETGSTTPTELPSLEKSHSVPVLETTQATQPQGFWGRRLNSKKSLQSDNSLNVTASASTTALDIKSPRSSASEVLRPARSSSISISSPIVGTDPIHADTFRPSSSPPDRDDALSTMASLSARSKNNSPAHTPVGSPAKTPSIPPPANASANSSSEAIPEGREDEHTPTVPSRRYTASSIGSMDSDAAPPSSPALSSRNSIKSGNSSIGRGFFSRKDTSSPTGSTNGVTPEGKRNTLAAVSNAAATAKRWGLNAIQRQTERNGANGRRPSDPPVDLNQPMGRGQPLPPPGTPLPGPGKKAAPISMPKRKPIAPPPAMARQSTGNLSETKTERRPVPPPPLPSRRRRVSQIHITSPEGSNEDNVLIVEAPDADSEPNSPSIRIVEGDGENGDEYEVEDSPAYMRPWVEDAEEFDGATDRDVSTNGGSEDLIEIEADPEVDGELTSAKSETPPDLPPRRATEIETELSEVGSEHHRHKQVEQKEEDEDEDGFTSWVDNPGPEPVEPAK